MDWQEFLALHKKEVLVGLAGVILLLGGWFYQKPANNTATFATTQKVTPTQVSSQATNHQGKVCVDVKGAVNHPGVYTLGQNARIQEAIQAAGGVHTDADMRQVNLAKQLQDQQVVYIPAQGENVPANLSGDTLASGADSTSTTSSGPKINLNQASKEQLCQINGIGDKKADMILQYRQQHGPFKSVDDLKNVDGFGDKTVAKLQDQVAV